MKTDKLPAVVVDLFKATNDHDSEAFMASFAADALVNDVMRTFTGKDAIKKWSDKEIIGDKITYKISDVTEHYGGYLVTALTDGNYDKTKAPDPLYLDHFFSIKDGLIVQLIIVKNTALSFKPKQ